MKIISFLHQGLCRYGVLTDAGVVDIQACLDTAPATINEFVGRCGEDPAVLAVLAERARTAPALALSAVTLLPCVPRPSKILCLGVNYHDHAAEGGNKVADYPTIFSVAPLRCRPTAAPFPSPPSRTNSTSRPNWPWSLARPRAT